MDNIAQPTTETPSSTPTVATPPQTPSPTKSKFGSKTFFIIAGILVVSTIAITAYFQMQPKDQTATNTVAQATQPLTLTIANPTEDTIVENGTLTIQGTTLPNTTVLFYTDTADGSADSDASGNFEGTISLENGINTLTITAFSESGEEKSITMDIVYDTPNNN
jgi:hypothetical protein